MKKVTLKMTLYEDLIFEFDDEEYADFMLLASDKIDDDDWYVEETSSG